jgi:hypothetical protein
MSELEFPSLYDLARPNHYMDAIGDHKGAGIIIVSGDNYSGKTTTITAIAHELKHCGWNVVQPLLPYTEKLPGIDSISSKSSSQDIVNILTGTGQPDALIMNDIMDPALFSHAFQLASEGSLVVVGINALHGVEALEKFLGTLPEYHGLDENYKRRIILRVHQKFASLTAEQAYDCTPPGFFESVDTACEIFQEQGSKTYHKRHRNNYAVVTSHICPPLNM